MLEWYRVGYDHHRLMDEVSALMSCIASNYMEVSRYCYSDLFDDYLGINPHTVTDKQLYHAVECHIDPCLTALARNDCLDLLFNYKILPFLTEKYEKNKLCGVFVYDYPASMSALARTRKVAHNCVVAERFELFVNGIELANGYHELCSGTEQEQRFLQAHALRKQMQRRVYPYDRHLVNALNECGLPQCSGVALGVDRLHMLVSGKTCIQEVLAFDVIRA